jgi:hypothetical protein
VAVLLLLSIVSGGRGAKHKPAPVHRAVVAAPVLLPPPANAPPTPAAAAAALGKIPKHPGNQFGPGHMRHNKRHP